jgi:hypothetical protein
VTAGIGGLLAVVGGLASVPALIGIGAGALVISLLLVPWLGEDAAGAPRDRADHGR